MTEFIIKPDIQFSFNSTLFSHGWIDLAPFQFFSDQKKLATSFRYAGNIYQIRIASQTDQNIIVSLDAKTDDAFKKFLSAMIKHMFRLEEDYSQFYNLANSSEDYTWISEKGAGRMFRCATLWEDMVKIQKGKEDKRPTGKNANRINGYKESGCRMFIPDVYIQKQISFCPLILLSS